MVLTRLGEAWRRLPLAARRYILYHCMCTPLLFSWYLVPELMLAHGLSVGKAGLLLSFASAVAALLNIAVGRLLDRYSPNTVIALIHVVEGGAGVLYCLGFQFELLILVVLAAVVERIAWGLYPAYAVYEYEAYPEGVREEAFKLHNALPFLVQAATYPPIGFLLALYASPKAHIPALAVMTALSLLLGLLPLYWLPTVGVKRRESMESKRAWGVRGFIVVSTVLVLWSIAGMFYSPLILVNFFIEVSGTGLLGVALYDAVVGFVLGLASLGMLGVRRRWARVVVPLGIGLQGMASLLLALSRDIPLALASGLLNAAGYAIADPYIMDVLFSTVPEQKRGLLLGSLAAVRRLVAIVMPAASGFLAERISASAPFLASAAFDLAAMVLAAYVVSRRDRPH